MVKGPSITSAVGSLAGPLLLLLEFIVEMGIPKPRAGSDCPKTLPEHLLSRLLLVPQKKNTASKIRNLKRARNGPRDWSMGMRVGPVVLETGREGSCTNFH